MDALAGEVSRDLIRSTVFMAVYMIVNNKATTTTDSSSATIRFRYFRFITYSLTDFITNAPRQSVIPFGVNLFLCKDVHYSMFHM